MSGCASPSALLFYAPDNGLALSHLHSCLPMDAFAASFRSRRAGKRLPFSPHLFRLFSGSGGMSWRVPRWLAGLEKARSLSALGRPG